MLKRKKSKIQRRIKDLSRAKAIALTAHNCLIIHREGELKGDSTLSTVLQAVKDLVSPETFKPLQ